MKTKNSALRTVSAIGIALSVYMIVPTIVKANACAGSHGQYTSVLCWGDDVVANGAYLISPDSSKRLYMQAHSMESYDTTTNPYTHLYTYYSGYNGDPYRMRGFGNKYEIWDSSNNVVITHSDSPADTGGYMKLHNDGCLYFHFSDDSTFGSGVCSIG